MTVVEVVGGFLTNSLALISDAGHMFIDSLSLLMSIFAVRFALKPATSKRTFGFYRVEIIVALVNGMTLGVLSIFIFYQAALRLFAPPGIKTFPMIIVAVLGLIANIIGALIIRKDSKENLNVKGAFLHIVGDTLSSVGVIIGGIVMYFTYWYILDPVISILIGIVILRGAGGLIKDSFEILLESVPADIDIDKITEDIKKISNAKKVHHLHFWTISSNVHALSVHIQVDDINVSDTEKISAAIREKLAEDYHIEHATMQYECTECTESEIGE